MKREEVPDLYFVAKEKGGEPSNGQVGRATGIWNKRAEHCFVSCIVQLIALHWEELLDVGCVFDV